MVVKFISPGHYCFPGQELAPSPTMEGCQRVREPDLSPLLYKPKPFEGCLIKALNALLMPQR
jgi:hypothetical protein